MKRRYSDGATVCPQSTRLDRAWKQLERAPCRQSLGDHGLLTGSFHHDHHHSLERKFLLQVVGIQGERIEQMRQVRKPFQGTGGHVNLSGQISLQIRFSVGRPFKETEIYAKEECFAKRFEALMGLRSHQLTYPTCSILLLIFLKCLITIDSKLCYTLISSSHCSTFILPIFWQLFSLSMQQWETFF